MYSTKSPIEKEELHYVALQSTNTAFMLYYFWGGFYLQNEIILKSSLLITADILT